MPAIADQVASIEHDLAVAQTSVDSLRSENDQLKTALAALSADHSALQAKHNDAIALVDETRQHADGIASAALAMLKVSRRQITAVQPSTASQTLQALAPQIEQGATAAVIAAIEPEKTDVRPELPGMTAHILYETGDAGAPDQIKDSNGEVVLGLCKVCGRAEIELSEPCGERIDRYRQDQDAGAANMLASDTTDIPNTDRLRQHMPAEEPLPIFLAPRNPPQASGVLS